MFCGSWTSKKGGPTFGSRFNLVFPVVTVIKLPQPVEIIFFQSLFFDSFGTSTKDNGDGNEESE